MLTRRDSDDVSQNERIEENLQTFKDDFVDPYDCQALPDAYTFARKEREAHNNGDQLGA